MTDPNPKMSALSRQLAEQHAERMMRQKRKAERASRYAGKPQQGKQEQARRVAHMQESRITGDFLLPDGRTVRGKATLKITMPEPPFVPPSSVLSPRYEIPTTNDEFIF